MSDPCCGTHAPSRLVSVADAAALVIATARILPVRATGPAAGGVLREALAADRPHPPFDRVAMDGIAARHADLVRGAPLREIAFQPAGAPPAALPSAPSVCVRVATGSILPSGADTVVPVEHLAAEEPGSWILVRPAPAQGANIHRTGSDIQAGQLVLGPGARLDACALGAAATFGRPAPASSSAPRIALVCTGDEIVPPETTPLAHQIRASHPAALRTALALAGFPCPPARLVSDRPGELEAAVASLETHDLLLCTGGVSVGERDLVPAALEGAGFRPLFHGVAMKPGKPLWFGVAEDDRTAFGLPGNPVSALVALARFVLPHLRARSGAAHPDPFLRLPLVGALGDDTRTRFLPVRLEDHPSGTRARPVPSRGSGDLPSLAGTDGFVEIPPGEPPATAVFRAWP